MGYPMNSLPFQIKFCGITTAADAAAALVAGADAIGLNFYAGSKRAVTASEAEQIRDWISAYGRARSLNQRRTTTVVNLYVNPTVENVGQSLASNDSEPSRPSRGRLDWIQLHGDEPPELVAKIKKASGLPIMRAFRWGREEPAAIEVYLDRCRALDCLPGAILIDSHKPGEFGGTGRPADWKAIARWRDNGELDVPVVLAGGLTPDNVAEAVGMVRPDAVDTAGGVESSPGRKDDARMRAFYEAASRAFAAL
jgi:phosphoribosylanthranilate isomerase